MPSVNNIIIYDLVHGKIYRKLMGDPATIILNAGEGLTLATVDNVDEMRINVSDPNNPFPEPLGTFNEGFLNGNYYYLNMLPTDGFVSVVFQGSTYNPITGSIQFFVDQVGTYNVSLSHPSYIDTTFTFTYSGGQGNL